MQVHRNQANNGFSGISLNDENSLGGGVKPLFPNRLKSFHSAALQSKLHYRFQLYF